MQVTHPTSTLLTSWFFLVHLGFTFLNIILYNFISLKYLFLLISTLKSGTCYRTASAQLSDSVPEFVKIWQSALVPKHWEISPLSFNEPTTTASH